MTKHIRWAAHTCAPKRGLRARRAASLQQHTTTYEEAKDESSFTFWGGGAKFREGGMRNTRAHQFSSPSKETMAQTNCLPPTPARAYILAWLFSAYSFS